MKQTLLKGAIAGALLAASITGVASAGADLHSEPGVAGEPDCLGQTVAWVVQGNSLLEGTDIPLPGPGAGNVTRQVTDYVEGWTVRDGKAWTEAQCVVVDG